MSASSRTRFVDHAARDARYGLRLLQRSPIFTVVAILSLALGIGANAAIFHLIDTIQLRSLAIAHPEELAEVRPDGPQAFGTYDGVNAKATAPLWELIRANQSAFSAIFDNAGRLVKHFDRLALFEDSFPGLTPEELAALAVQGHGNGLDGTEPATTAEVVAMIRRRRLAAISARRSRSSKRWRRPEAAPSAAIIVSGSTRARPIPRSPGR